MVKRYFDVLASFVGLCLLMPLFLIIVLLIFLSDGLPLFFVQQRIGQHGRLFPLYKFRTMEQKTKHPKKGFDAGDGSRITPLGKILRKTKLDELPQLFNVLKGDMSLVGPRPEVKEWTAVYPEKWEIVHRVKPGITDEASLKFRNEEELLTVSTNPEETYRTEILPKKLDLNIRYVQNNSLAGDLKIILKTIKAVWGS